MNSNTVQRPVAILGDLNALYHASKDISEKAELNYAMLKDAVSAHFNLRGPNDVFTLWSSSDQSNLGQQRLLQFLEKQGVTVRRFSPRDSFVFEPEKLGLDRSALLIQRFSGSIAFAAGVLCKTHRIVFMSDSFQLAEPLVRASTLAGARGQTGLIFWKTRLDPRWHSLIDRYEIDMLDLDTIESRLFRSREDQSAKTREPLSGFDDDFLLAKK